MSDLLGEKIRLEAMQRQVEIQAQLQQQAQAQQQAQLQQQAQMQQQAEARASNFLARASGGNHNFDNPKR